VNPLAFVVLGRLDQVTGGYLFDRRLIEELRAGGRMVRVVELEPASGGTALDALPDRSTTVIDGLALPSLAEAIAAAAPRLRLVGFVHHPLAEETGLCSREARRLARIEAAVLPQLRGIVCPSRRTGQAIVGYGVPAERVAVTPPGTDRPAYRPPRRAGPIRRLLCIGNVIPRKGYDVLVRALTTLADLEWSLVCIGSLERDVTTVRRLRAQIAASGLGDRITLAGEQRPDAVAAAYEAADAFVLATRDEGYGMVCAEAMAYGLPQVTTAAGAVAEVVPPEAGLLVAPNDADGFAAALRRLITMPELADRLASGACNAAKRLPSWQQAAAAWASAVDRLAG
jgi:glycosyltransferase involved in cell wall biosynthesis